MTDKEIISGLLALGEELITRNQMGGAMLCTVAAARLMEMPSRVEVLRHPSGKVADTITVPKGSPVPFKKNLEN